MKKQENKILFNIYKANNANCNFIYDKIITNKPSNWIIDENNYKYLIVIGGDGTFLDAAQKIKNKNIKVILINGGNIGFYSAYDTNNFLNIFKDINNLKKIKLLYLEAIIDNQKFFAFNEFFISSYRSKSLDIWIDDIFLENLVSSGIIFSTPYGSTAHNKSAGGAIIHENNDIFQMLEIHPIFNKKHKSIGSPLILNKKNNIKVKINYNDYESFLIIDGRNNISLKQNTIIKIKSRISRFELLLDKEFNFIKRIKEVYIK